MLNQIIKDLTQQQKADLYLRGIAPSLISVWKTGKRRPTYAQCVSIAEVTKCNLEKLLLEVALNDALPEQKKKFNHLLKK